MDEHRVNNTIKEVTYPDLEGRLPSAQEGRLPSWQTGLLPRPPGQGGKVAELKGEPSGQTGLRPPQEGELPSLQTGGPRWAEQRASRPGSANQRILAHKEFIDPNMKNKNLLSSA